LLPWDATKHQLDVVKNFSIEIEGDKKKGGKDEKDEDEKDKDEDEEDEEDQEGRKYIGHTKVPRRSINLPGSNGSKTKKNVAMFTTRPKWKNSTRIDVNP